MTDNAKLAQAKSLHIFMFPFTWSEEQGDICKFIKNSKSWVEEGRDYTELKEYFSLDEKESANDPRVWNYNQDAYFYTNVNQAINISDSCIVSNWKYHFNDDNNFYEIKIEAKKDLYRLNISYISLKIYNTGIGILSFHLLNSKYDQEEDILCINDYGRRIFPPFLPLNTDVMAESITLRIGQGEPIVENYKPEGSCFEKFPRISKTIMSLLGNKFTYNPKEAGGKILIKPVIDDRMFVVCWWGNNARSPFLKDFNVIMNDGEFWHKFFFIDHGSPSCRSSTMMKSLLEEHAYDRWINEGTLYGITRYSFMLLTSNNSSYLKVHMWTIYYQMVCLVLAQRASILNFSKRISEIVSSEKEKINSREIQDLHYKYLKFVNQLYFREVTAQEQGIEMYDMMINSMAIERDVKRLNEEIGELYQYIRLEEDKKTNESLYLLTILGALFILPNLLTSFFGMNIFSGVWLDSFFLVMLFIVPIVLALVFHKKTKFNNPIHYEFRKFIIVSLVIGILCFILWKGVVVWLNCG